MSRATIGQKTLLAATLSLLGGLFSTGMAQAAIESADSPDAGNQAGKFTPVEEKGPSNWSSSFPPSERKEPTITTITSSDSSKSSGDSKSSTTDSGRSRSRKLPSAVEMLKRFQKGGNPNEIMSNADDSDSDKDAKDKDSTNKPLSPSLVHNFGPHGALIPVAGGTATTQAATEKDEAKTDDAAVNKEPAVAPESAEVLAAVRSAYNSLSKGKADEALATMTAIVKKEPRSMLARRATAFVMLYSGNARESVDQLFVLAALPSYQPQSFDRCTLGDAYLMLNRPDNALIAFEDALKINSDNVQARSGELRSMVLVGRVDEAMTDCVEAYKKAKQPVLQRYYRQLYVSLSDARNQINGGAPISASGQRVEDLPQANQ